MFTKRKIASAVYGQSIARESSSACASTDDGAWGGRKEPGADWGNMHLGEQQAFVLYFMASFGGTTTSMDGCMVDITTCDGGQDHGWRSTGTANSLAQSTRTMIRMCSMMLELERRFISFGCHSRERPRPVSLAVKYCWRV